MTTSLDLASAVPELAAARDTLRASLWRQSHLPGAILELCRLRLAQLHRSAHDCAQVEFQLHEAQRAALDTWNSSGLFGAAERACLAFTEVYAMDAAALTDEQAAAVKAHFGDAGLVTLIEALGVFDGAIRVNLLWGNAHER